MTLNVPFSLLCITTADTTKLLYRFRENRIHRKFYRFTQFLSSFPVCLENY